MKIKLIAIDCDGTLYDNHGIISKENLDAIERASENGVEIVPATGRSFDELPQELKDMKCVKHYILSNGASVMTSDKVLLHSEDIPADIGVQIAEKIKNIQLMPEIYLKGTPYAQEKYMNIESFKFFEIHPKYFGVLIDTRKPVNSIYDYIIENKPSVEKFNLFFPSKASRQSFIESLSDLDEHIELTGSMSKNLEINKRGANKGTGMKRLCEKLGIDIGETMAIGDSNNDISMIKVAGLGVAVANACLPLKEQADVMTVSNEENAVAAAINEFVFNIEKD